MRDLSVSQPADAPAPADVLLRDGSVAVLRCAGPADVPALAALHDAISEDNLRLRFFTPSRHAAQQYVAHLATDPGPLVLVLERDGAMLAVATAEPQGPGIAEVAFLVADDVHGLGVGSLLLEHLAAVERARGVRRFVAEVLADNHAMLDVFLDAGFTVARRSEAGSIHVEMDTVATARAVAAADERECQAEARSLRPLLYPRTVAVAGVRRDGTGVGAAVLRSIVAGGYTGQVFVVHRSATDVAGVPAYPRLVDVPVPVELLVVAVPADAVLGTLAGAADAHVPAAVVITSGFEELGEHGADLQRAMLDLARRRSIRLVGPNCLGLMSNHPDLRLNATFSGSVPPAGGFAVASQSGGVGIVLSDVARDLGLGVGSFVSLGNKADVSSNDLLAAWRDDPQVTGAGLYLESFGNAAKFARVARRFAERKPLLAVVGGSSAGGRRAGASHTAAVASPTIGVQALFAQAGVIPCEGAEDLAETALLLSEQPLPAGNRVAILSNAGGMGVLAADAADRCGLAVPELSARLSARLRELVTGTSGTHNPVDAGAGAAPADVAAIVELLLASGEVDALVVVLVATGAGDAAGALAAVGGLGGLARSVGRPLVLVPGGGLAVPSAGFPGVTTYRAAPPAVRALARAAGYAAWRAAPHEQPEPADRDRAERARRVADGLLDASRATGGWLDPEQAATLLTAYGLAPSGRPALGPDAAVAAAEQVGYPVAVKVAAPDVVHKTDRGLVRVGITGPDGVRAAVRAFAEELARPDVPVLVQPVARGVEFALGLVRDPGFGPMVMVAAGGVATELWDDHAFLLPPVTPGDAGRALRSLRTWPLLDGYRGSPRLDAASLERLLVGLGQLAEDVPQLAELDLNPVIVAADGTVLVDVKARLAAGRELDAGIPRRLRRAT